MRELYTKHRKALSESLKQLPLLLQEYFEENIKPHFIGLELDSESGGITKQSYNSIKGRTFSFADDMANIISQRAFNLLSGEIERAVSHVARNLTEQGVEELSNQIQENFTKNNLFGNSLSKLLEVIRDGIQDTLQYTLFPGRRPIISLETMRRSIVDVSYPNSVVSFGVMYVKSLVEQAFRDAIAISLMHTGRSRVKLVCTDGGTLCNLLEGEYDVRFVPEITEPNCTCQLEFVDEPMEYPNKVYVDGEPVVVPTLEDINRKKDILRKVEDDYFSHLLSTEINYMEELYNSFATDKYLSGKVFGKSKTGRNTVSFGDEIEILAQYVYGGETTLLKSPVDIIHPIFCIETKGASAMEKTEDERGHIATSEVVRKYLFIGDLVRKGYTKGNHKYVLGVFDTKKDTVTLYEQNYLSNKNSRTMTPVCKFEGYSNLRWKYESTPYREFKVVGLDVENSPDVVVRPYRGKSELLDPFFWEVVRAHKANVRDGDRVEFFDGHNIRKGVIYDEGVSQEDRYRVKDNFNKYHSMFPRRATYSLMTNLGGLKYYLSVREISEVDRYKLVGDNHMLEGLSGIVLEFEDLHHLEGFDVTKGKYGDVVYGVKRLPLNHLVSVFLTDEEYEELITSFEGANLKIRPVDSKRRIRRQFGERLEYDVIRPCSPHLLNGPVIRWEDGDIEQVDYNFFNSNYRLYRQGKFETLHERGLGELAVAGTKEIISLTYQERLERIEKARSVLNSKISIK